ncbi:MAG: L-erythro-3,5-diaminohexanoate dehydrogenase [Patescibacteria group bacterium]
MNYGFHRVIRPVGVVPQAAWKVNNYPKKLHSSEKIIDVKFLNLDSTSMRQLKKNYNDIGARILEIIGERGKMHNPITNSGGVLLGEYNGKKIIPWTSLSAIPLQLTKIKEVYKHGVEVEGTAVLFESYHYSEIPLGMDWRLAITALDIASLPVQVKRIVRNKKLKILILGCGKAGLAAMAAIKTYSPLSSILGIDINDFNFNKIKNYGFTKKLAKIDASNAIAVLNFAKNCDLVINCVNAPNTEAASVLAVKERGTVMFFSMATQFDKASLATDAIGKDVNLIIGSGIARGEDKEIFDILRQYPQLFGKY